MILNQILLQIFHKFNHERSVSAAYHLIRGKRSGQTIQDVGIFKLHPYFGLLPKFSRKQFDAHVQELVAQGIIEVDEAGGYRLTATGIERAKDEVNYPFSGWYFRGNEHVFFARLSLIVQSLSYQKAGISLFIPVQRNEQVQQWTRQFLLTNDYKQGTLQNAFYEEMLQSLTKLPVDDSVKGLLMARLAGHGEPGYTWQQLAYHEGCSELDVQLMYISMLHSWLDAIHRSARSYPLLTQLLQGVRIENMLTSSTNHTANLYKQGYTAEQISHMRRLKMSTIEDHIVEMAMYDTQFDVSPFVTEEDCTAVFDAMEAYNTKKLKVIKEVVPHLSYFQIRLIVAKGGVASGTY